MELWNNYGIVLLLRIMMMMVMMMIYDELFLHNSRPMKDS